MPASPPNRLCWNLAKPGKSVRVNDLDDCSRGGCHLVRCGSSRGKGGGRGGRQRGYGEEICLNLAARNLAHRYTTNDIILPWKESWWKFAMGSQLPTGGCHALWLEKYFFHWQIPSPDPLFFFCLQWFCKFYTFYKTAHNRSLFHAPVVSPHISGTLKRLTSFDSMKQNHAGKRTSKRTRLFDEIQKQNRSVRNFFSPLCFLICRPLVGQDR